MHRVIYLEGQGGEGGGGGVWWLVVDGWWLLVGVVGVGVLVMVLLSRLMFTALPCKWV